jgi:hypothetical protein
MWTSESANDKDGIMLTNKMHFTNQCFNSILFVFYTFRTPYIHHQEDDIAYAALYGMFFILKLQ